MRFAEIYNDSVKAVNLTNVRNMISIVTPE